MNIIPHCCNLPLDFTVYLHVVYRLVAGFSCVLYIIGAALWIYVGARVAIPSSDSKWTPSYFTINPSFSLI